MARRTGVVGVAGESGESCRRYLVEAGLECMCFFFSAAGAQAGGANASRRAREGVAQESAGATAADINWGVPGLCSKPNWAADWHEAVSRWIRRCTR